jgi:hypothetical protein
MVNVEPAPYLLWIVIQPPIASQSFLVMASPNPVPPYLRVVEASAWVGEFASVDARLGDCILASGTLGDRGMTIVSLREGIEFETTLESDRASLHDLIRTILAACPGIRCMRDPTRGGLSSALNELASTSRVGVKIDEAAMRRL